MVVVCPVSYCLGKWGCCSLSPTAVDWDRRGVGTKTDWQVYWRPANPPFHFQPLPPFLLFEETFIFNIFFVISLELCSIGRVLPILWHIKVFAVISFRNQYNWTIKAAWSKNSLHLCKIVFLIVTASLEIGWPDCNVPEVTRPPIAASTGPLT